MRNRRLPTPFGRAVRVRLAQLNMQQRDLARLLGISQALVTYLIYGDRRDEQWILRICQVLDMESSAWMEKADDRHADGVEFAAKM